MLKGSDVSSYQGNIDFDILKKNSDFIIAKVSEGNVYYDPKLARNQSEARRVNLALGYYHFARPDLGNTPEAEAQAFINGFWPAKVGELITLDFEVNYYDPVGWCKRWLDYIASKLNGTKAIIYLNQSLIQNHNWSPVSDAGYGLWVASYDNNPNDINFDISPWKIAALKQWSSTATLPGIPGRIDIDSFYGDLAAFKKYGYKEGAPTPIPPDPYIAKFDTARTAVNRLKVETDSAAASSNKQQAYNDIITKTGLINKNGTY